MNLQFNNVHHGKAFPSAILLVGIMAVVALNATAQDENAIKLLQLATEHFSNDLSIGEKALFVSAAKRDAILAYPAKSENEMNIANAAAWSSNRTLRANRLAWLCTDPVASALVTSRGIEIVGFRIDGVLNLRSSHIPFQLTAYKCVFTDDIFLGRCHIAALSLIESQMKSLNADGAEVESDVLLRSNSKALGVVRFASATINGNLDWLVSTIAEAVGASVLKCP